MFGNKVLPGLEGHAATRCWGSIWKGDPESTWGRIKKVKNKSGTTFSLPLGTVLKMDKADGAYTPMELSDIASDYGGLPGPRLTVVADQNVSVKPEGATVGVGICGEIDRARLIVGGKAWSELTDAQRVMLEPQLALWGFGLNDVMQA